MQIPTGEKKKTNTIRYRKYSVKFDIIFKRWSSAVHDSDQGQC